MELISKVRKRLDTVQALRAFAATIVVIYHAIVELGWEAAPSSTSSALNDFAWLGNFGVDVFFVISGLIMVYSHYDDFGTARIQKRFLMKRIERIVPNYWVLTTLGVVVLALMPGLSSQGRTLDLAWIGASYLFIPWTSVSGVSLPVLGLGWTLNYEMYFYVVFSFALLLPRKVGLLALFGFLLTSIAIGTAVEMSQPILKQTTSWLLVEFLAGVALGVAFRRGMHLSLPVAGLLLVYVVLSLSASLDYRAEYTFSMFARAFFFGGPALALVAVFVLCAQIREMRVPTSIMIIGNASYALYLTHVFTLPFVSRGLVASGLELHFGIAMVFMVVSSLGVAVTFYKLFERPTQKLLRPTSVSGTS